MNEETDPFTDWLEESDHGDLDFWGVFTIAHLEAAFWAGEQTGFEKAAEYYRMGGSLK